MFFSPKEEHIKNVVFNNKIMHIKCLNEASRKSRETNFVQNGREYRTESQGRLYMAANHFG